MAQGIAIRVERGAYDPDNTRQVYRLRLTASRSTYVDNCIFRYRKEPIQPGADQAVIACDGVCSIHDMMEYEAFEARASDDPPYFRLDYVEWLFAANTVRQEAYDALMADINSLFDILNQLDEIEDDDETVIIGTPADDGSSSSSSEGA